MEIINTKIFDVYGYYVDPINDEQELHNAKRALEITEYGGVSSYISQARERLSCLEDEICKFYLS